MPKTGSWVAALIHPIWKLSFLHKCYDSLSVIISKWHRHIGLTFSSVFMHFNAIDHNFWSETAKVRRICRFGYVKLSCVLSGFAFAAASFVMILIPLESVESQLSYDILCVQIPWSITYFYRELCAKCVSTLSLSANSDAWRYSCFVLVKIVHIVS